MKSTKESEYELLFDIRSPSLLYSCTRNPRISATYIQILVRQSHSSSHVRGTNCDLGYGPWSMCKPEFLLISQLNDAR